MRITIKRYKDTTPGCGAMDAHLLTVLARHLTALQLEYWPEAVLRIDNGPRTEVPEGDFDYSQGLEATVAYVQQLAGSFDWTVPQLQEVLKYIKERS
jgi:hypothetical protein